MKKVIVYASKTNINLENSLEIIESADDITDEQLEKIASELIPGVYYKVILKSELDAIVTDKITRRAATFVDDEIKIHLQTLKNLVNTKLRDLRIDLLRDLDVKYIISLEKNQDVKPVTDEKNRLRHITSYVNSLTSVNEVLSVTIKTEYDWSQFEQ